MKGDVFMNFYNTGGSGLPPSPIGNVMIAGMQQQQQQIPFFPVGGYYTNYNTVFNPWEVQRQQDALIKRQNDYIEMQIQIQKELIISSNKALGHYIDEEALDKEFDEYRPKSKSSFEILQEAQKTRSDQAVVDTLYRYINSTEQLPTIADAYSKVFADSEKEMAKRYEGKTLEEQYDELNLIRMDQIDEETKKKNRNFSGAYSSNGYRSLVSNNADPSRTVFANIDDMEVTLPSSCSNEYQEKRAMFLAKLLGR